MTAAAAAGQAASVFLARRLGTMRVYTTSLIGFIIASAICAAAPNVSVLIAARAVQGLVRAPLVPLAMSLLLAKQARAAGSPSPRDCYSSVVLAAASAGLPLLTTTAPLWVTAAILSGRAVAIEFGITPLPFAMLHPLTDAQLADGNTVFTITQRLGGSLGVSLLASLFAAGIPVAGPVTSFHEIGLILTPLALGAAVLSLRLAPIRQPAPQPMT